MFTGRSFNNEFAGVLNECIVNEGDGTYFIHLRFRHYLESLEKHINDDNELILEELKNDEPEVRSTMLKAPHIDNSLNYFKQELLASSLVAIYSYLDNKLDEIAKICKRFLCQNISINKYKKIYKIPVSDLEKNLAFIYIEILKSDTPSLLSELIFIKEVRKKLVHNNFDKKILNPALLTKYNFQLFESIILLDLKGVNMFNDLSKLFIEELVDKINSKYELVTYFTSKYVEDTDI